MGYILVKDREFLDTLEFRMNLVAADAPLAAFIRQVNLMPVFDSTRRSTAQSCQSQAAAAVKEVI